MTYGKFLRIFLYTLLIVLSLFIFFISGNHDWIEKNFSMKFYPKLASSLRILFGRLPFSLGDVIYTIVGIVVVWQLTKFIIRLFHKTDSWKKKLSPLITALSILMFVYVYFYMFWGLNYYRKGIEYQLGLEKVEFQKQELIDLTDSLLQKVNRTKEICLSKQDTVMSRSRMFASAREGYEILNKQFSFIQYKHPSLKASLFGSIGNYVGFLGYYNPFTGEGQVNTKIPLFMQPYVTCHEMAHQVGYASESEANFVGYLAASHSNDTLLQYSTYLDMFLYSWNNLSLVDSSAAGVFRSKINDGVKRDLKTYYQFIRSHRTFVSRWTNALYDYYLRHNRQLKGIESYGEVSAWAIAYRKKFGRL